MDRPLWPPNIQYQETHQRAPVPGECFKHYRSFSFFFSFHICFHLIQQNFDYRIYEFHHIHGIVTKKNLMWSNVLAKIVIILCCHSLGKKNVDVSYLQQKSIHCLKNNNKTSNKKESDRKLLASFVVVFFLYLTQEATSGARNCSNNTCKWFWIGIQTILKYFGSNSIIFACVQSLKNFI